MNKIPALLVVTQRPRDLTREDLRKLKLALDQEDFGERSVQAAWRDQKNEDIAATIVGYIRQLALGSPLKPYSERVDRAVARLRKEHRFTDPQSKWLDRIAKQVKIETVVDRASLDAGQFKTDGGFARLNKVFDGNRTRPLFPAGRRQISGQRVTFMEAARAFLDPLAVDLLDLMHPD
jgi:type I restriction enzyme R subunit